MTVFVLSPMADAQQGVYLGAGCAGAARLPEFEAALGRGVEQVVDYFGPQTTWARIVGDAQWSAGCWAKVSPRVNLDVAMPMLASDGSTLAQAAGGRFDAYYLAVAQALVSNGFANSIVRIGWEMNGGWYPWAAARDPASWVSLYQRIVTIFRSVPGQMFKFAWNPTWGWQQIEPSTLWPGGAYVDYVAMDVYDQYWPATTDPAARWSGIVTASFGLSWLRAFATKQNLPIYIPEWGVLTRPDGHGGGDDPYFIAQMAAWMAKASVARENYFNFNNGGYYACLISCAAGTTLPAASAAYVASFGN